VLVLEASATAGGGLKTEALTLPGFTHDICSSIHPLAVASPFFRFLQLDIDWLYPDFDVAHPLDGGRAGWLKRSVADSAENLGTDAAAYRRLMEPLAGQWEQLLADILCPLPHFPQNPWLLMKFGTLACRSAAGLARSKFKSETARALFAGLAAHSFLSLRASPSAAVGLLLGLLAHGVGWPMPRGGSVRIAEAMTSALLKSGGEMETGHRVNNIDQLPPARAILLDVSPRQLLAIAGHRFPPRYRAALARYRYGPGVFKIDYALSQPIPWAAAACRRAGTVHVGGTLEEIALSESQAASGVVSERPFILVVQNSLFDSTRAPAGKHTAWAYCHVPNGSVVDMTGRIENQIERFAPGFRDCVLMRATQNCRQMEERNPNLIGGDINGGLADFRQMLARPVFSLTPYRTPARGIYLCSASTPPSGGVHGMCGFNAAKAALKHSFGK